MKDNFDIAFDFVLKHEGTNYVNDPNDPGGETKYGISKRSYPNLDIFNLSFENAKSIYYSDFWLKMNCDELESPLDICAFNCAVNCGPSIAYKLLQNSTNWRDFLAQQIYYYTKLKNAKYFIFGWVSRTLDCWKLASQIEGKERG